MPETISNSRRHLAVASLLAGLTVALQLAWASTDTSRPLNDDRGLYRLSICFSDTSRSMRQVFMECRVSGTPYPPLTPLLAVAHFKLAGAVSVPIAIISQWPFYALLVISLFYGVRREAGTLAGAAAAVLGPVLLFETHMRGFFYTAIPLAALTVASITCLRASEGFRRPLLSLGLGTCLAAGLLTKWTFAFFLCPPVLLAVMLALLRVGTHWWVGAAPAALFFGFTAATAAGMAGVLPYGLALGGACLALGALYLALLWQRRRELLVEGWQAHMLGIGIFSLSTAALAGPWYLLMKEPPPGIPHGQPLLPI